MELKPGSRWKSAVCDVEAVVVRPPRTGGVLTCGGSPLRPHGAPAQGLEASLSPEHDRGSLLGKRYADPESGLEVLCSKGGRGSLAFEGRPLAVKEAKKLPSSD